MKYDLTKFNSSLHDAKAKLLTATNDLEVTTIIANAEYLAKTIPELPSTDAPPNKQGTPQTRVFHTTWAPDRLFKSAKYFTNGADQALLDAAKDNHRELLKTNLYASPDSTAVNRADVAKQAVELAQNSKLTKEGQNIVNLAYLSNDMRTGLQLSNDKKSDALITYLTFSMCQECPLSYPGFTLKNLADPMNEYQLSEAGRQTEITKTSSGELEIRIRMPYVIGKKPADDDPKREVAITTELFYCVTATPGGANPPWGVAVTPPVQTITYGSVLTDAQVALLHTRYTALADVTTEAIQACARLPRPLSIASQSATMQNLSDTLKAVGDTLNVPGIVHHGDGKLELTEVGVAACNSECQVALKARLTAELNTAAAELKNSFANLGKSRFFSPNPATITFFTKAAAQWATVTKDRTPSQVSDALAATQAPDLTLKTKKGLDITSALATAIEGRVKTLCDAIKADPKAADKAIKDEHIACLWRGIKSLGATWRAGDTYENIDKKLTEKLTTLPARPS